MCLLLVTSCTKDEILLTGKIDGFHEEKIYLNEFVNEHYNQFVVVDSANVEDGNFEFNLENKPTQLYFIGNGYVGGKVFVEPAGMRIDGTVTATKAIKWNVSGSSLHKLYETFVQQKDVLEFKQQRDSSNQL